MASIKYKTEDGYVSIPLNIIGSRVYLEDYDDGEVIPELVDDSAKIGNGIGTCSTSSGTALEVDIDNYKLVKSGIVTITFQYDVPANATLNINNQGAKAIYNEGSAITAGVIEAGSTIMLTYDGTNYVVSSLGGSNLSYIEDLIPAQASSSNQLADKEFVNSSVSTATATYRGCYNLVSDLSLTTQASHGLIETALASAVSDTPDNNDYAFVQIPTDDSTPTEIASVERYKFNGTLWSFEYALNNSGFTAAQWTAINSNITSTLVTKLSNLSSQAAASGGTTESLCTTGEKYTWNSKLSASNFTGTNKGTNVNKVMVADASNGLGYSTLSNLASVLGVIWKSFLVSALSSRNTYIYGYSGDAGAFNCFVFTQSIIGVSQTSYQFGLITYNHSSGHPQYKVITTGNNGDPAYNISIEFTVDGSGNIYIHNHTNNNVKVTMVVIPCKY